eukprot:CAMPEP_0185773756 /NCGR_PEP_ID=MMETSP1174-20130828/74960_1 /TAXON_ID=35687 /ORGANISM="Dictyocha speculum, Strain CCMP1381" /LENGTH=123 /DNA_ID=CAMNT_0028460573 /DNA_START=491 /DNA_END=862 /DNA_ORIENTATION=-
MCANTTAKEVEIPVSQCTSSSRPSIVAFSMNFSIAGSLASTTFQLEGEFAVSLTLMSSVCHMTSLSLSSAVIQRCLFSRLFRPLYMDSTAPNPRSVAHLGKAASLSPSQILDLSPISTRCAGS